MFKVILIIFLIPICLSSYSQNYDWVNTISGGGNLYAWDIANDSQNNTIVCGRVKTDVTFGSFGNTEFSVGLGHTDIYLAKFDPTGNMIWKKRIGGTEPDWGRSLSIDQFDNIYMTGDFVNFAVFEGDTLWGYDNGQTNENLVARTGFISKFDSDGNVLWKNEFSGGNKNRGFGIAADSLGNSYVTGTIMNLTDFDGIIVGEADANTYSFIAKYNPSGICVWSNYIDSDYDGTGYDIQLIDNSRLVCTGNFENEFTYDGVTIDGTNPSHSDYYLMQIDSAGGFIWCTTGVGTYKMEGYNMTLDQDKNIYVTGHFSGTMNLYDTSSNLDTSLISAGGGASTAIINENSNSFIAKYNVAGDRIWIRQVSSKFKVTITGITTMGNDALVVSGYTRDTMWYNNEQDTIFAENGFDTGFILAYDLNGNYLWKKLAITTGTPTVMSYDALIGATVYAVSADKHCNLFAGGMFGGTINLDAFSTNIVSGNDIYIAKIFPPLAPEISFNGLCLNDTLELFSNKCGFPLTYSWQSENNSVYFTSLDSFLLSGDNALDSITFIVSNGYETDTATLSFELLTPPTLELGPDIVTCDLNYTINSGSGGAYYDWGSGATAWDSLHFVTSSGLYTVTVSDSNGCSSSDNINILLDSCGWIDQNMFSYIHFYPNPSNGTIKIIETSISKSNHLQLKISNLNGRLMLDKIIKTEELIDISELPKGIYILSIIDNNKKTTNFKLIII